MPVYFITGSARGIGLELVDQLSSIPSNTIIAAARTISDELRSLEASRPNLTTVILDVSSESSIASLPSLLPEGTKLDYVINNAGIVAGYGIPALEITADTLQSNMQTNVLGPALTNIALIPFLAPSALVVNVSSGIGSLELIAVGRIPALNASYSISKAALNMLTVHQAHGLKGKARVVCLDPGHVKTRLGGDGASVEIEDSAKGIRKVLDGLKDSEQQKLDMEIGRARYVNFLGGEVPW